MVPGGRLIRKYIYRMIFGLICLPAGIILLFWNERNAIIQKTLFQGVDSEWVYWAFRAIGFLFLLFCFNRIFSAIKIFMSKIPLTYNDIRNAILFKAFLYALAVTLIIVSICWVAHQPAISIILVIIALGLIIVSVIRIRGKRKPPASKTGSVKPHRTKDV